MKNKLIVGLGNPGKEYENTKHNIGFKTVGIIKDIFDGSDFLMNNKFEGEISSARYGKYILLMLKPMTFMNLSGRSVQKVANFYDIEPENILVIHDELDLPVGNVKMKWNGWHNGHNGLKSINQYLSTAHYWKLKVWVSRPPGKMEVTPWVLGKMQDELVEKIETMDFELEKYIKQFMVNN